MSDFVTRTSGHGTSLHAPRTSCVYCGRRIPGALPRGARRRIYRAAARIACSLHYDLVAADPWYNGTL